MAGSRREREDREERVLSARKLVEEYKGDMDRTSMRVPAGVSTFKIEKEGTYEIDIIPYNCGKGNPNCDEGEPHYERIYYQHFKVGVDGHSYICLSTFGEKCPVCEEYAHANLNPRLTEEEKKAVKQLKKKERQVLNIIDVKDPKKGIQIWDTSTFWFWQNLQARLKRAGEDSPYNLFADPVKGYTLIIGAVEKESGGFSFINCVIDGFERREKPYSWKVLDESHCLDDMLVETDYEDLYNILKGEPKRDREKAEGRGRKTFSAPERSSHDDKDEDRPARRIRDEEEDAPRKSRRDEPEETEVTAKEMEIEVDSVVDHEDLGTCTVTKVSKDGKTISVEDDRKKVHKDIPVGEFKIWDGEEDPKEKDDEPAPRGRSRREEPEDDPPARSRKLANEKDADDDPPPRRSRKEEPEPEDDPPARGRRGRAEPEEEADDAPRSRRGKREEPEDDPPRRGRGRKEEAEDEPLEDTDAPEEPAEDDPPRRGRRGR